jgi:hypothetical protein
VKDRQVEPVFEAVVEQVVERMLEEVVGLLPNKKDT